MIEQCACHKMFMKATGLPGNIGTSFCAAWELLVGSLSLIKCFIIAAQQEQLSLQIADSIMTTLDLSGQFAGRLMKAFVSICKLFLRWSSSAEH